MKLIHPHRLYAKYGYTITESIAQQEHSEVIGVEVRPPQNLESRPRFLSPDVFEFPFWKKAYSVSALAADLVEGHGVNAIEKGDALSEERECLVNLCPQVYKPKPRQSLPENLKSSWCRRIQIQRIREFGNSAEHLPQDFCGGNVVDVQEQSSK